MKKKFIIAVVTIILLVLGFYALNSYMYNKNRPVAADDLKDAEYVIDGKHVKLDDGVAETESSPDSASKIVTRYFGNEVETDLNGDGRDDVVFLLTQETGGSGTFFYVVAALATEEGYIGSEALLLGDRIAPQTTEVSRIADHKGVVVVNYADRAPGEPMTTPPSVGKSIWLKLNLESMQFGEVAKNFEGEADPSRMTLSMKTWDWISATLRDGTEVRPTHDRVFTLTFGDNGSFSVTTDCNIVGGSFTAKDGTITFDRIMSTKMYCEESQESAFVGYLKNARSYRFTSRGEFIIELADGGTATFR